LRIKCCNPDREKRQDHGEYQVPLHGLLDTQRAPTASPPVFNPPNT